MKPSYFDSLFKQESVDFHTKSAENQPIITTTTSEPHVNFQSVVINNKEKQQLTDNYHTTTRTTAKKHIALHAQARVEANTTQECSRDIFTSKLQKAAHGLPITLPELVSKHR